MNRDILSFLMSGDVSIQYQTQRDLLGNDDESLQERIAMEGWGRQILSKQKPGSHWGDRFYQPKWISTHYTLLDLRHLCLSQSNKQVHRAIEFIIANEKGPDGGVGPFGAERNCDVCVNGMFLNYASYFTTPEQDLESIIDFLIGQWMMDGGFNCRSNRSGAIHSSVHSTISVLEGISSFEKQGYSYRLEELRKIKSRAIEFLLLHKLFKSDRTGEIIHKDFLKLSYPSRWKYDILRALDYLKEEKYPWDTRLQAAIDVLHRKRRKDGLWNVQAKHPGQVHVEMEKAGKTSRWNTLRVMRVFQHFNIPLQQSSPKNTCTIS